MFGSSSPQLLDCVTWSICVARARHGIEKGCDRVSSYELKRDGMSHSVDPWTLPQVALETAGNSFEHVYLSIGLSAVATKLERCARCASKLALPVHCLQAVR